VVIASRSEEKLRLAKAEIRGGEIHRRDSEKQRNKIPFPKGMGHDPAVLYHHLDARFLGGQNGYILQGISIYYQEVGDEARLKGTYRIL